MIVKWIANKGREGVDRLTEKSDSVLTLKCHGGCAYILHFLRPYL